MHSAPLRLTDETDFISSAEISRRVAELARHFTEYFKNADEVLAIVLMQGGMFFAADLVRAIDHPNIVIDTIRAKSYDGVESTDQVAIKYETDHHVTGKHVLLIEDILDKGTTLARLTKRLQEYKPATIAVVAMFEKPTARAKGTELTADDYQAGIQIADKFVLGYGLDWNGRYRHLPFVTTATEAAPGQFVPRFASEPH